MDELIDWVFGPSLDEEVEHLSHTEDQDFLLLVFYKLHVMCTKSSILIH